MIVFSTFDCQRTFPEDGFWDTGLISEKTEVLHAELNERAEVATSSYSVTGDSLEYIYFVLLTKNHRDIQTRCLVYEFSFTDVFDGINHGYRATILKKKIFLAASILYGCGYLFLLWKGAQNDAHCNYIKP